MEEQKGQEWEQEGYKSKWGLEKGNKEKGWEREKGKRSKENGGWWGKGLRGWGGGLGGRGLRGRGGGREGRGGAGE